MRRISVLSKFILTSAIFVMVTSGYAQLANVNDLVINGESFFAMGIFAQEISKLAAADGYINQGEQFKNISVSGAPLANIINQYKNCNPKPKYVLTSGGGIDMMGMGGPVNVDQCVNTCKEYLKTMADNGTEKVLYLGYPRAMKNMASMLNPNLEQYCPKIKALCESTEKPRCYFVDLWDVWGTNEAYTSDGIHQSDEGAKLTAQTFWKAIIDNNIFDISSIRNSKPLTIAKNGTQTFLSQTVSNNNLLVSMFLSQPSRVNMNLTTVSGRRVTTMSRDANQTGYTTVQFPVGAMTPGVYCLEVQAGKVSKTSSLVIK